MHTKYQVGDVVLVRSDLGTSENYPMEGYRRGFYANYEMTLLSGRPVTISECRYRPLNSAGYSNYFYIINEDNGEWSWTDAMFDDNLCADIETESLDSLYDWLPQA